jgi:hypothetical protein
MPAKKPVITGTDKSLATHPNRNNPLAPTSTPTIRAVSAASAM